MRPAELTNGFLKFEVKLEKKRVFNGFSMTCH